MKLYDIKIGVKNGEKTFWRNIGTVFAADNAHIVGTGDRACSFSIDYPKAQGIIVPRKDKNEVDDSQEDTQEPPI